jgi:AbrB family looped-hinge helix DNA binding protein
VRHGIVHTMRTTIDRAGRIVVPKRLRDQLGLSGGQEVELVAREGKLEVAPAPTTMRLEVRGDKTVAVADRDMPPLTVELVRETLEQTRR